MSKIFTGQDTVRVAIVGSGPSGFYAAESLLRSGQDVDVHMFEKLPVPFGLVRYGVAPDHPKLKSVTAIFERIALMDGFRFVGNVEVGKNISISELHEHYNAIVFAYGTQAGKRLEIPGESLSGCYSAHEFVAWYNGHPDFRDLSVDLSHETATVIGQGNVALDIARILAKPVDELRKTDIADHALQALAESRVRSICIIGRRGPAQVQFVSKELREFNEITNCMPITDADELILNTASRVELADPSRDDVKVSLELLHKFAENEIPSSPESRHCRFYFNWVPVAVLGNSRIEELRIQRTLLTGDAFHQRAAPIEEFRSLDSGLLISSVGYRTCAIDDLPLASSSDHLQNIGGRLTRGDETLPGLYAAGWVKRGPRGTIGTNRGDSVSTVEALLADRDRLPDARRPVAELFNLLQSRGVADVSLSHWRKIDSLEVALGANQGRPRVKLTSVAEMLTA